MPKFSDLGFVLTNHGMVRLGDTLHIAYICLIVRVTDRRNLRFTEWTRFVLRLINTGCFGFATQADAEDLRGIILSNVRRACPALTLIALEGIIDLGLQGTTFMTFM